MPDASFFRVLGPVIALQLILMVVAIIDLVRREPERVRGPKWAWALIVVVAGFVGPIVYFIAGRKE